MGGKLGTPNTDRHLLTNQCCSFSLSHPFGGLGLFMCEMKVLDQSEVLRPTCASGSPGVTYAFFSLAPPQISCREEVGSLEITQFWKDSQMIQFPACL